MEDTWPPRKGDIWRWVHNSPPTGWKITSDGPVEDYKYDDKRAYYEAEVVEGESDYTRILFAKNPDTGGGHGAKSWELIHREKDQL